MKAQRATQSLAVGQKPTLCIRCPLTQCHDLCNVATLDRLMPSTCISRTKMHHDMLIKNINFMAGWLGCGAQCGLADCVALLTALNAFVHAYIYGRIKIHAYQIGALKYSGNACTLSTAFLYPLQKNVSQSKCENHFYSAADLKWVSHRLGGQSDPFQIRSGVKHTACCNWSRTHTLPKTCCVYPA